MKQLLLILAFLMGYCVTAFAENIKLVPSADDSTRMDTIVVSSIQNAEEEEEEASYTMGSHFKTEFMDGSTTIAIVSIIIVCGLPFFIVAIVLWFRYKNKQAKYKLAAEALAAGQTIPKELFNEPEDQNHNVLSKGIKNLFLGIGLGVFLWVLTEEEGLAAIGFLIFCMGLGQILIAYTTSPIKMNRDENGKRSMKVGNIEMSRDENGKRSMKVGDIEMSRDDKTGEKHITRNNTNTDNDEKE